MKTIHKTYKFRLYPTSFQKMLLAKHFGSCRFVFNRFLHQRKEKYESEKISLNYYDNAKALTELKKDDSFVWLRETNAQALQQSLKDLDGAYKNFFKNKTQFPKFKSKTNRQSFRIPQAITIQSGKLMICKFREGIKLRQNRELGGKILFATVSKTPTDKYFVSIVCEVEYNPVGKNNNQVGIDIGIKDLAILSNGKKYENIKPLRTRLKKLKYEQRQLSKKKKGSNSRNKQRRKVAACYEKITNIRNDYLHKVSTEIIRENQTICVENLNVKGMLKNHCLAQAISDVSWGEFCRQLEYKADWNDRQFVKIGRFFPSSKTCSNCGWVKEDLTLSIRKWECLSCNTQHDRDINASLNILKEGLSILSGSGVDSNIKQKQVEALPLGESKKPEVYLVCK